MCMVDVDESGKIDYEEFLAATLSQHQLMKEENMLRAFQHFDENKDGTISREELKKALQVCSRPACTVTYWFAGPLRAGLRA